MAEDIVDKVISFFAGDNTNKMSDKEVVLQQRYKDLVNNKYSKFYKPKTDEADMSLGQFFYSLYKLILPIRIFMKDTANITRLRQMVLESYMDDNIMEIVKKLNPLDIDERYNTTPPDELIGQVRKGIENLSSKFDSNRINGINESYDLIMLFFHLVNFDYPALIKKFDANFTEGPFFTEPKFSSIKASLAVKDIGEFLAVSGGITAESDWKTLLNLLKTCAGKELIGETQFIQMIIGLKDVLNSNILELIIQLGSKNPIWINNTRIPEERIAEAWLETRVSKANDCIASIKNNEKGKEINSLVKEIFDNDYEEKLENYNSIKGDYFKKRGFSFFSYAEGLNCLHAFLKNYIEGELHELCDILLIRGQWKNVSFSKEMSEAFHQLTEMSEPILSLDETLSDEGADGARLKAAIVRSERDRTQVRYINSIIENANEAAQELLVNASHHGAIIHKHLNNLIDDIQKKHPEMVVNWRELNLYSKEPLLTLMTKYFEKLNGFLNLMKLCS